MNRIAKAVILAAILCSPLFVTGCVYYPPRPYYGAVWVPGHWGGPQASVWIAGHWR